jgi:glutathione S-transferase
MTLYDSPGCWKCVDVREALDRLGLPYESVTVRGNPEARATLVRAMGEPPSVPMLVDGDAAVWDRRRILAHLEATYGGDPAAAAALPEWMGGSCRLDASGRPEDPGAC